MSEARVLIIEDNDALRVVLFTVLGRDDGEGSRLAEILPLRYAQGQDGNGRAASRDPIDSCGRASLVDRRHRNQGGCRAASQSHVLSVVVRGHRVDAFSSATS